MIKFNCDLDKLVRSNLLCYLKEVDEDDNLGVRFYNSQDFALIQAGLLWDRATFDSPIILLQFGFNSRIGCSLIYCVNYHVNVYSELVVSRVPAYYGKNREHDLAQYLNDHLPETYSKDEEHNFIQSLSSLLLREKAELSNDEKDLLNHLCSTERGVDNG